MTWDKKNPHIMRSIIVSKLMNFDVPCRDKDLTVKITHKRNRSTP